MRFLPQIFSLFCSFAPQSTSCQVSGKSTLSLVWPHCPESLGNGCANTGSWRTCCEFLLISSPRQFRISKRWQCLQLEHSVPKGAISQVSHLMVWTCAETPCCQCPESEHCMCPTFQAVASACRPDIPRNCGLMDIKVLTMYQLFGFISSYFQAQSESQL